MQLKSLVSLLLLGGLASAGSYSLPYASSLTSTLASSIAKPANSSTVHATSTTAKPSSLTSYPLSSTFGTWTNSSVKTSTTAPTYNVTSTTVKSGSLTSSTALSTIGNATQSSVKTSTAAPAFNVTSTTAKPSYFTSSTALSTIGYGSEIKSSVETMTAAPTYNPPFKKLRLRRHGGSICDNETWGFNGTGVLTGTAPGTAPLTTSKPISLNTSLIYSPWPIVTTPNIESLTSLFGAPVSTSSISKKTTLSTIGSSGYAWPLTSSSKTVDIPSTSKTNPISYVGV